LPADGLKKRVTVSSGAGLEGTSHASCAGNIPGKAINARTRKTIVRLIN
jgi:hypothetical protein